METTAERLYQEREKRTNDAISLKIPDRVPVMSLFGFFPARYSGISFEESMYNYNSMMEAWVKAMLEFEPDMYENPFTIRYLAGVMESLDYKQLKWPGRGCNSMSSYQYIEDEYMKGDEYPAFLFDLSDFMFRTYWPRIFGKLEPLKNLPPLHSIITYYMGLASFAAFDDPEVIKALEAIQKAAKEAKELIAGAQEYAQKMKELGFPPQFGSLSQAPFDTLSDFFRGTKGAMLDMFRQPDHVLEATEKLLPIMFKVGLSAKTRGCPRVFIPLHKGLDGFMSEEQFKRFYWPTLRRLITGLIEEELNPILLWEGDCTSRLEIIGDIPAGKAVYWFEKTDIFKAKEILGDRICIRGNVPLSIMSTGTVDDVKKYCKKLIDFVGKDGGFILDCSTVLDDAKPENLKAMIDFAKDYGKYN